MMMSALVTAASIIISIDRPLLSSVGVSVVRVVGVMPITHVHSAWISQDKPKCNLLPFMCIEDSALIHSRACIIL